MVVLGIECAQKIFDICKTNLTNIRGSNAVLAKSESFDSFCPARVVVNYDGGIQAMSRTLNGQIHQQIMRKAFCSPTVDVVVSTRLNWDAFWDYFGGNLHLLGGSLWKCIYIKQCVFGGSKFTPNVWFRMSPMHACTPIIDKRMQNLIAGDLV
jgi:hypothetical protein